MAQRAEWTGGVPRHAGRPGRQAGPLYPEVAQLGTDFGKAGPALEGTSPRSEVAILHTYPSVWAIDWQRHNKDYDPIAEILSYYQPLKDIAQSIDIVQPTVPLDHYKLVVAPGLNVLSEAAANNLIAYVRQGGNLVLGQRSGMKNSDNGLQPERQPGPLVLLLGGRVDQYYALINPVPVSGQFGDNTSKLWAELLSTSSPDTKVLETYGKSNGWLDGKPAIITRKVGRGSITYVGAWMDEAGMAKLAQWMTEMSGVTPSLAGVPGRGGSGSSLRQRSHRLRAHQLGIRSAKLVCRPRCKTYLKADRCSR